MNLYALRIVPFVLLAVAGCTRIPGNLDTKAAAPQPRAEERSLASYLHDLSPKLDGVTADTATLEHLRIPTRSGAVLDGWIRRPPIEEKVPVVVVFTPYYGGGDPTGAANVLGEPGGAFTQFLIPYGYAVGFVSVGGTGNSSGCFRDGGEVERQQLYDAVEFIAAQPWANGAVASIGVSYDGTTSNELFVDPPPSLKTVVPMEAITDYYRYSFNNGMRRGLNSTFTAYYYAIVGLGPAGLNGGVGPTDPPNFVTQLAGEACPDQALIQAGGAYSTATGDKQPSYWYERDAIRLVRETLDRPRPSMFWVGGYQDANVDLQHADGWLEVVKETGVPLHIWNGQWVHAYPQPTAAGAFCDEFAPCRGDFFEVALLAWFDQFLKGRDTGILDAPMVQTQGDDGIWRHQDDWPGEEVSEEVLYLDAQGALGAEVAAAGTATYTDDMATLQPGSQIEFVSAPLPSDLRLTGMPRLETLAIADAERAGLVATLLEQFPDGSRRYVNFAAQSLNHAENLEAGDLDITDEPIRVRVNFFPQDNVLYAGSQLVLVVGGTVAAANVPVGGNGSNLLNGGPNLLPVGFGANVALDLSRTRLILPVNAGDRVEPLSWLE
jgi:predicted acyl esterase